jgi:aryl-alcohol dehydrogenase-like predicted oxidoreductase
MKQRSLGKSGLQVSPLCLGGNVFGWTADEPTSFAILDTFVDAGFNFVDTADVYSRWVPGHPGGESETVIGNWIARSGKRQKLILATKLGKEMGPGKTGLSKAYMIEAVEASLRRLQTDYIDLYQSHADDPDTPQEETMEAYGELMKQGKVRAIGASNFGGERLAEALKLHPRYECLQPQYNLCERADYETNLEPLCASAGIGVIPYYGLASGFLTGKYRSEADLAKSPRGGGVKKYMNDRGFRILAALDKVAQQYESTPARVALAWLMARPSITAPIASATSVAQLRDLLESASLELDQPSIELLNQASQ